MPGQKDPKSLKMRARRPPEAPGRPLRHPWGTLGALQGAVGAVLVPSGETPPNMFLGEPGPAGHCSGPAQTAQTAPTTRPPRPKGPTDLTDQTFSIISTLPGASGPNFRPISGRFSGGRVQRSRPRRGDKFRTIFAAVRAVGDGKKQTDPKRRHAWI